MSGPTATSSQATMPPASQQPDYRVAIDFGTTYTAVAFNKTSLGPSDIRTIGSFPGARRCDRTGTEVPTESWYPTAADEADVPNNPVLHGHQVINLLDLGELEPPRASYDSGGRLRMMKLLLDNSKYTRGARAHLTTILNDLKERKAIENDDDVIRNVIAFFFTHIKDVFRIEFGFNDQSTVEVTFCVPVCWDLKAISRMSSCVEAAMKQAQFGTDGISPVNLFMVNEAEAGAINALSSHCHELRDLEVFIIVDCGGGTTDVGTYRTANTTPLRIETEVNNPLGAMCGSGGVNDIFGSTVDQDLRREPSISEQELGMTYRNIIDSEFMPRFEEHVKRTFGFAENRGPFTFRIRGLKQSNTNPRIKNNTYSLSYDELYGMFQGSLHRIAGLLRKQYELAQEKQIEVDKVVVIGGFSESPLLQQFLSSTLDSINDQYNTNTRIVFNASQTSAAGVAIGALLRAMNKEKGPKRTPRMSIGITQHIEYEPLSKDLCMKDQDPKKSRFDGKLYIMNTIYWLIKKGQGPLQSVHTASFEVTHYFDPYNAQWLARELLWGSYECTDDYFQRGHGLNYGRTFPLGTVVFDLTDLRPYLQLEVPDDGSGKPRYKVTVRIEITVIDRDLKFKVYWPAKEGGTEIAGSQQTFSVVAAFLPGTD